MDITAETVGKWLKTEVIGRQIVAEEELVSTNATVREMAEAGLPEGMLVVAERQTGGIGRNGRSWYSPAGRNLYFSLLLRPDCQPEVVPQLAIVSALSQVQMLEELCPQAHAQVKWPNDVWCQGGKLSGILCSMSCLGKKAEYAVVGIGINVNLVKDEIPADVPATSMKILGGSSFNRAQVLATFLNFFEADYRLWQQEKSLQPFLSRWQRFSLLEQRRVTVEQGNRLVSGTVDGISAEGHLRLLDEAGNVQLAYAGDAHVMRREQE